jgi:hypothetical protein
MCAACHRHRHCHFHSQLLMQPSSAAAAITWQLQHRIVLRCSTCAMAPRCVLQGAIGRNFGGQRFGPRPIDLDVIFYEDSQLTIGTPWRHSSVMDDRPCSCMCWAFGTEHAVPDQGLTKGNSSV